MGNRLMFRIDQVRQLLEQTATGPANHLAFPGNATDLPERYDGRHLRVDMAGGIRLWASNHDEVSAPAVYAEGMDPRVNLAWLEDATVRYGLQRLNAGIDCVTVEAALREADAEGQAVTHLGLSWQDGEAAWDLLRAPAATKKPARRQKAPQPAPG